MSIHPLLATLLSLCSFAIAQPCSPYWNNPDAPFSANYDCMVVFDDGSGPMLYAAGRRNIARWDGGRWTWIESGLPSRQQVGRLISLDFGDGSSLYVVVRESGLGGEWVQMRWDVATTAWVTAQTGLGGPDGWPFLSLQKGQESAVYGLRALSGHGHAVVRWDGSTWNSIGETNLPVHTLVAYDDGSGPMLHVAGSFNTIGGVSARGIARWTGSTWEPLGRGVDRPARSMVTHDFGTGPELVITDVNEAGGVPVNRIARWDGQR